MLTLNFEEKYAIIGTKDPAYEGLFFTAVKTTGIFCRPSCRARKPKAENVVFYNSAQEALQHGYRPCKVCKPMEPLSETPEYVKSIINDLHQDPDLKIKDWDLQQQGIAPSQIRRWFKNHHGLTFHAYQRLLRINTAFTQIQNGRTITDAAFESGFDSLSAFNDSVRTLFGAPPSKAREKTVLNLVRFTTPIGPMFACASNKGLCLLEFTDRRMLETEFKDLRRRLNAVILPGENAHLKQVQSEMADYFGGTRQHFNVPLHTPGTTFQQAVWKKLQDIPYGETRSYSEQARHLGKPRAVRAVASANGHNRIAIIIPCHRVVGADGNLTGYGGGLHRKKWLLDFEKARAKKAP